MKTQGLANHVVFAKKNNRRPATSITHQFNLSIDWANIAIFPKTEIGNHIFHAWFFYLNNLQF